MRLFNALILFMSLCAGGFAQVPATEVRAVWLTTNWALDWPAKQGSSVETQKEELQKMLDVFQQANFNTILFQVRAQGKAFYKSKIEPMSDYFNHADGFDPLAFVIEECHKRGLECHAWIIAYPMDKVRMQYTGQGRRRKSVPIKDKPDYYKMVDSRWYLDPGRPETRELLVSIVAEIVSNYDVDGVHFDNIRYPDSAGKFPDEDTYHLYGNGEDRADWRRGNINLLVAEIYDKAKSIKGWVQVSSSPLGRYRVLPDVLPSDSWTGYEAVYQDAGHWMRSGKHDLIFPMMYHKGEYFYPFVDDWVANSNGRTVVPGLGVYMMEERGWPLQEITDQMRYLRNKEGIKGTAYFRARNLTANLKGIMDSVQAYYPTPAKLPPLTWLDSIAPNSPAGLQVYKDEDGLLTLKWEAPTENEGLTYTVYKSPTEETDRSNPHAILITSSHTADYSFRAEEGEFGYYYSVSASDRYHNESITCFPAYFSHSANKQ